MTSRTVLVLVDHTDDGTPRPAASELLGLGRRLGTLHAVWLGAEAPAAVLETAARFGVEQVHAVATDANARLTPVAAEALAAVLAAVADGPALVLVTSTFENKEVLARLGVLTGAGAVVDATSLVEEDGRLVATKSVFAATWTTRCAVRTDLALVAAKPNAAPVEPAPTPTTPVVVPHTVAVGDHRVQVVERTERAASGRPDLASAQVVVVGGRGTEGDFGPLEELADVLGGAVGATRVATDEGWIDRDAQIGQTGVTVSPRLYIGAGVSGAVHHRGGMQSSGTIVAVNDDPEAPIFEIADLGIVGDLRTVIPQATAELRRLLG
jgi:electron transfer flavoprotein alpha subunit